MIQRDLAFRRQKHHLDFDNEAAMHVKAIELCVSDLFRAFEYVEPHEKNLNVFSHRFYELLLCGCTEFESIAKHILRVKGEKADRTTIKHYFRLMDHFPQLQNAGVSIQTWNPHAFEVWPFVDWTAARGPEWYRSYNAVKHSRQADFEHANLLNAVLSIGAVLTLVSVVFGERVLNNASTITWTANGKHYTGTADQRLAMCQKIPADLNWDSAL